MITSLNSLFNLGLYAKEEIYDHQYYQLNRSNNDDEVHKIFCPYCSHETLFKITDSSSWGKAFNAKSKSLATDEKKIITPFFGAYPYGYTIFKCLEEPSKDHEIIFFWKFHSKEKSLFATKIGQYPSLADLQKNEIKKYEKQLGKLSKEFSTAIGLFAHGVGIGSWVYLRRILEHIIENTHKKAKEAKDWNEKDYKKAKLPQKIDMLSKSLPQMAVECGKHIYSILSKGIHELDEKECRNHFPLLKACIEIILDEQKEKLDKEKKRVQIKQDLETAIGKLS